MDSGVGIGYSIPSLVAFTPEPESQIRQKLRRTKRLFTPPFDLAVILGIYYRTTEKARHVGPQRTHRGTREIGVGHGAREAVEHHLVVDNGRDVEGGGAAPLDSRPASGFPGRGCR